MLCVSLESSEQVVQVAACKHSGNSGVLVFDLILFINAVVIESLYYLCEDGPLVE